MYEADRYICSRVMFMPKVSVILSTHNDDKYIGQAVDSILNQTYTDFELILINDGSTDDTAQILDNYADKRIVRIDHDTPQTLPVSLNEGIARSSGKYIARMDGDDISHPTRLAKQVAFLDVNPNTDILGTHVHYLHQPFSRLYTRMFPTNHSMIVWLMFMDHPLIHPTIMMRARIQEHRTPLYNTTYRIGQDFELWNFLLDKVGFANLPDALLTYRVHNRSITKMKSNAEATDVYQVRLNKLKHILGYDVSPDVMFRLHYINSQRNLTLDQISEIIRYAFDLFQNLSSQGYLRDDEIDEVYQNLVQRAMYFGQQVHISKFGQKEPRNPILKHIYKSVRQLQYMIQ